MPGPKRPYDSNARSFVERWEAISFEDAHASWLHLLPEKERLALDIGAGSGRDAAALAARGWEVVAVEPSASLRRIAEPRHQSSRIHWLDDSLPSLSRVHAMDYHFGLILLSAVWMHVPPARRERAFRKLTDLLEPGGLIVFTIRPPDPTRGMHAADVDELAHLARKRALIPVPIPGPESADLLGRRDVRWTTVAFRMPDDGTGALPLLRNIILNDRKSATHKLALLRVLTRIADGARGMVLRRTDESVTLPFGLVALYWLKAYKPLLFPSDGTPPFLQQPDPQRGLGFVNAGFKALKDVSPHDFRVAGSFGTKDGRHLVSALGAICSNITRMPARHTTYSNGSERVFGTVRRRTRLSRTGRLELTRETLSEFGEFVVPANVWDTLTRFSCWIEPVVVEAWRRNMKEYDARNGISRPDSEYRQALTWLEPERDVKLVRALIEQAIDSGEKIWCVWSGVRLRTKFQVDHCLPFAVWPNSDLWNLLPTSSAANAKKSDQLPSADLLVQAQETIMGWWRHAYPRKELLDRYKREACSSLPIVATLLPASNASPNHDAVFRAVLAGIDNQRLRLRTDQQVREWDGP